MSALEESAAFEKEWAEFWKIDAPGGLLELPRWLLRQADRKILYTDETEYIDRDDLDDEVREEVIRIVERTSRIMGLGYWTALFLRPVACEVYRRTGRPVKILDVGTGHGDIILRAAEVLEKICDAPISCAGLDYNPRYVELARRAARERGRTDVEFIVGNAFDLDLDPGAYDVLITNWMIHHLTPSQVYRMVREFDRVAAHGMMLFDVARSWPVAATAFFVTAPMSHAGRHDSMVTMRRGYRPAEMEFILEKAGVDGYVKNAFPRISDLVPWLNVFSGLRP